MKTLIIVDPQNDFITGTLSVGGAVEMMNNLSEHLSEIKVDHIIVTMDAHPINHISFEKQGGPWPAHCMKYSWGAAIWAPLFQELSRHSAEVLFLEKGVEINKDQYSAFEADFPEFLNESEIIYICGIAGDICVLNSLKDLIGHGLGDHMMVIEDASPSLDDGRALRGLIRKADVKMVRIKDII